MHNLLGLRWGILLGNEITEKWSILEAFFDAL